MNSTADLDAAANHPQVKSVMRQYITALEKQVARPALDELKALAHQNPGDQSLAAAVRAVEKRIEHRLSRIRTIFDERQALK